MGYYDVVASFLMKHNASKGDRKQNGRVVGTLIYLRSVVYRRE